MTDELFALLEKRDITSGPDAREVIAGYNYEEMMDLAADCFAAIDDVGPLPENKLFNFAPIPSIAGAPWPCSSSSCRLEAAYSFSLIAALYAEKVILPNFFDYMFYIINEEAKMPQSPQEIEDFEHRLCSDIAVCFLYKPLFDAKIAVMNFTVPAVCKSCHIRHQAESKKLSDKLDAALFQTRHILNEKVNFIYEENDYITVENKDNYLGGSLGYAIRKQLKAAMRKHKSKTPYTLSENEINRFGLRREVINATVNDILEYDFYPSLTASTYLTNRQFDLDLLGAVKDENKTALMTSHMPAFHELPFLQDISLEDAVKLRKTEESSFKVYRNALAELVNKKDPVEVSKFADSTLMPALDNINNIVVQNQKKFKGVAGKKIVKRSIIAAAGIGASNLLGAPIDMTIGAITTTGLFSVQDIIDDLSAGKQIPTDAKIDPYYFLWGIQQKHTTNH